MRNSKLLLGALALSLGLAGTSAFAGTVFSTGNYSSDETGDYFINDEHFQGVTFELTQQTQITGIGGHFSQYSNGSIFGAIVAAASLDGLPTASTADLEASALAHTVFAADGSDQIGTLSVNLAPGFYTVIFGSGLWGATGTSSLATGQDFFGNANLFQTLDGGASWLTFSDSVRLDVQGVAAVPVPAALPLFASSILGLGVFGRRRARKA